MKVEEAKKELARLIIIFYDCRKEKGINHCFMCQEFFECKYKELHEYFWTILTMFEEIRRSDPAEILEPYLKERPDVLEFLKASKKFRKITIAS